MEEVSDVTASKININNVPAVVVFAKPGEDPGDYHYRTYPVAAWDDSGLALVIVPGHARLVAVDDRDKFSGWECVGVQPVPTWGTHIDYIDVIFPEGNGPFF